MLILRDIRDFILLISDEIQRIELLGALLLYCSNARLHQVDEVKFYLNGREVQYSASFSTVYVVARSGKDEAEDEKRRQIRPVWTREFNYWKR